MDDRTRFKLAGRAMTAAVGLWVALAVVAVVAILLGVRAVVRRSITDAASAVIGAASVYGVWFLSTSFIARLITNESKGYRPWQWGMKPRTEAGRDAERFNIPLSYSEAKEGFAEGTTGDEDFDA